LRNRYAEEIKMEAGAVQKRNPYIQDRGIKPVKYDTRRRAEARRRKELLRRKRIRRRRIAVLFITVCVVIMAVRLATAVIETLTSYIGVTKNIENISTDMENDNLVQGISLSAYNSHPAWTEDFLSPNEYSRPGDALTQVNSIFVHYTANPGTTAQQNRSYFESLKDSQERSASAHFIIDADGEIIQCIPLDEIAYAVKTRNYDSISIECCYTDTDGSFTEETYDSLIKLLSWLTDTYNLDTDDILRHYDCGGKKCPIYYVNNPDAWEKLKKDVAEF
jgi:hypothetical protein